MIEEGGGAADQVFESNGVKLFVDPVSISYLKGAEVDFVDTVTGGGFTIKNPNAVSTCGCGSVVQRLSPLVATTRVAGGRRLPAVARDVTGMTPRFPTSNAFGRRPNGPASGN